ncbi:MAG: ImmA/IrrE family metallo-endopeptidase [Bacteroidetes bacterium]|nr:ImmA/IrrE family metallo-endopeptidase [Bacteroidota bacterium]MBU1423038.1 ImmA/IrrE family metallo-endopeptidase [Bacteroidota bacterium]MBU2471290.1 ImmA/IrrE family metallo-endopeptidase [Bacteroidota bacterium]MBU2637233.1 ImmA/IrrE family metallo-endopeptidase [Bacteroidota bacterium]
MARSIPALVNHRLLEWARKEAGYTDEEAAEKLKRSVEELRAWESGDEKPTLRQAERLAKIYKKPYSVFTLSEPPKTTPLATEYRRLPNVTPGKESPELRFALRDLLYRRHVALELFEELGELPEKFSLQAKLSEQTEELSRRIRNLFQITHENQFNWQNDSHAWKAWRNAVEVQGILVLLFSDATHEEVRGVSLFHSMLPVIGINTKEITASRPFTLMHEFIHILLANGNEEKPAIDERHTSAEWKKIEEFTERVAGGILMPEELLKQEHLIQTRVPSSIWSIHEIQRLARKYKVTPLAFTTRLLILGRMNPASYRNWKDAWKEYLDQHPPKKGGFATPAEKSLNRNGLTYTTLVIDALNMERITPVSASKYLNVNYPYVEELRLHIAFGEPLPTYRRKGE